MIKITITDENRAKREELKTRYNKTKSHRAYQALMEFEEYLMEIKQSG